MQAKLASEQNKTILPNPSPDNLNKLSNLFQRYQQLSQKQFQQSQLQQAQLKKSLAGIESRLRNIEVTTAEQLVVLEPSPHYQQFLEQETEINSSKTKDKKFSDADVGHWMNETLSAENWNKESTEQALGLAEKALVKVPGVYIEEMQCNDRFCRATFADENNQQAEIGEIFGEPPFVNEGFTIHQANGQVALYFAQPGESLEELQKEAKELSYQ